MNEATAGMAQTMPEMADIGSAMNLLLLVRLQQWDEVLAQRGAASSTPVAPAIRAFAHAMSYAGKGRITEARERHAEFERLRKAIDPKMDWSTNKVGPILDLASVVLAARLEAAPAAAVAHWRRAVDLQDSLIYDEPPPWYYPVRESLGGALLRSGDAAGAETVFREGLRRSPNNGRMLFGLLESLKAQRKTEAAAWVQKEFETSWKGADIPLRVEDL